MAKYSPLKEIILSRRCVCIYYIILLTYLYSYVF